MALIPRLQKRPENGIYYCRVAVPKDLVSVIGKREIKVSLQTTNLRMALKALARASYVADCEFMAARGEQPDLLIPSINQGISIKQLTEKYFAAHEQAKLTASTIMEYKIRFRVIMELMGADKPIKTITRQDCRAFQQQVLVLPPNAYKRFPKMGLVDVIAHAKRHKLEPMAPKTVNQHISCLNLLMEWAGRERLIDANPARGLWVEETKLFKDKRDPFTVEQLKLWLRWTGKVWEQSATAANECAKLLPKEVLALSNSMPEPDSVEEEEFDMKGQLFGHAKKMLNTPLAVLSIAASDPKLARRLEDFDAHPTLINATNGVVDLKTGELLPHDAVYLMTRSLRVDYKPEAQSDLWSDFLSFYTDGNPEIEAYLARVFGGIGLVDGNPDEVMMMLSGPAANGKSTFIGAVSHVMGSYTDILRTEVLMGDTKFSDFRNDIADLKGARLVISSEPPQHCKLNCAFIKGYTGGDELKGRHNYASSIKFKASGLPVLQTNWEPRLPHGDVAMHRRLQLYRHDTVVLAEKRNQNLKDALGTQAFLASAITSPSHPPCVTDVPAGTLVKDTFPKA